LGKRFTGEASIGVILLRLNDERNRMKIAALEAFWLVIPIIEDHFTVVSENQIRISSNKAY
jgi:hypothetical protein